MPEIATQTEHEAPVFKVLTPEEEKQLSTRERKEYRKQLRNYKRERKRIEYNEYMRVYMSHYRKMKYKYDPAYREKAKYNRRLFYYTQKAKALGLITDEELKEDELLKEQPVKIKSNIFINSLI